MRSRTRRTIFRSSSGHWLRQMKGLRNRPPLALATPKCPEGQNAEKTLIPVKSSLGRMMAFRIGISTSCYCVRKVVRYTPVALRASTIRLISARKASLNGPALAAVMPANCGSDKSWFIVSRIRGT